MRNEDQYCYDNNGLLHNDDGPAVMLADGTEKWYVHGKLHRVEEPAIKYPHGSGQWWCNGQLHRECGPAIEVSEGFFLYIDCSRQAAKDDCLRMKKLGDAVEVHLSLANATKTNIADFDRDRVNVERVSDGYRVRIVTRDGYKKRKSKLFFWFCDLYDLIFPRYIHIEERGWYIYGNGEKIVRQEFWRNGVPVNE